MTIATRSKEIRLPDHPEAMELAETEYRRFVDLLRQLEPDDWGRPTDCTLWDVKALVAHNLGNMEANAAFREMVHQLRIATKRAKASGNLMVDEMTALHVAERAHLTPAALVERIAAVAPRALKGRRRLPGFLRRWVRIDAPPPLDSMRLGYLIDTIYTRDIWMHRVDISRAAGRAMVLDAEHDGRVVAAIVCDWAGQHGQPYDLVLAGPAGGSFHGGVGGEELRLDAVEFCRIVSGRNPAAAVGLLKTEVLF
jgi:uncharacterized protein (TIGR03083 family)